MGEYALHHGQSVKIGTCENLYYLRADQARQVIAQPGNVDPIGDAERGIRFRFPFPDEDAVQVGHFDVYDRSLRLPGVKAPAELAGEHDRIQFRAERHGYLCSLPCPESMPEDASGRVQVADGIFVGRNGFRGATFLSQQRLINGHLVPILECTCGMKWRVETLEDCAPIFESLEGEHARYCRDREPSPDVSPFSIIAERIRLGFDRDHVASLGFDVGAELVRLPCGDRTRSV